MFSEQTVDFLLSLLGRIRMDPMDPNFEAELVVVMTAKKEALLAKAQFEEDRPVVELYAATTAQDPEPVY